MFREKRRYADFKPNRKLDAKSSRGLIYENEELRIRTININAEVDQAQSEIDSLKREKEQLRQENWALRERNEELENLLRLYGIDSSPRQQENHTGGGLETVIQRTDLDYSRNSGHLNENNEININDFNFEENDFTNAPRHRYESTKKSICCSFL